MKIQPDRVIDLGCGTGGSLAALCERYPQASIAGVVAQTQRHAIGRHGADQRCAAHLHHANGMSRVFQ